MTTAKQGTLVDAPDERPQEAALVPANDMLGLIERLACRPDFDVAKLEKLIEMKERVDAHNAKAAFDAAFSQMQPELPEIDENGRIMVKGVLRSTYAKYEDIKKAVAPILKQYGFAIRHKTQWPNEKKIRVVGILSHAQGHREESEFEAEADHSDYRTDIQSQGSTVSYGRRYTTLDLLNITTRGQDNDGQGGKPETPEGFEQFVLDLEALVPDGINAVTAAFNKASTEFKNYMVSHHKEGWTSIKNRAQKVTQERGRR